MRCRLAPTAATLQPRARMICTTLFTCLKCRRDSFDIRCRRTARALAYDLSWSPDGTRLVSASADGSAIVWHVPRRWKAEAEEGRREGEGENQGAKGEGENDDEDDSDADEGEGAPKKVSSTATTARLLHKLHHEPPMYVYCAQFHPFAKAPAVIATGGYDSYVRLWRGDSGQCLGKLDRGRKHHKSHINCAVFTKDGNRLITGDGAGCINVWRLENGALACSAQCVAPGARHQQGPLQTLSCAEAESTTKATSLYLLWPFIPRSGFSSHRATVTRCASLS